MKHRAFTIVEILCVIIILSILSVVLMPVFANATMEAKSKSAKQNLQNLWRGLKIYQSDNEGKVEFGLPQDMGLPPEPSNVAVFLRAFKNNYHPNWSSKNSIMPCGSSVGDGDSTGIGYMPTIQPEWDSAVKTRKNNTILLYDKNCNVPGTRVMCQFCSKRSIGITLGGSIRDRINSDWMVFNQDFYQ